MSVAKPLPHDAARLHVTGQARYTDDLPTTRDTLHLAFGVSDVANGTITSVDLDAVRAAPGVIRVYEARDLPSECDCSPSAHDEPLLAQGSVHYVGQPIFLVAATSHLQARYAATLGRIEIAATDPALDVDAALDRGDRFEEGPRIWTKGDAEAAIAAAPHVIEGSIAIGGQEHFYLEGQAALVIPQEGGDMLVHASTQHPTEIQHKVAHALHLPMHAVRVETRRMGGGFGGKESQGNALAIACAVVARDTGRSAKMRYDRDDDFVITGKRHDMRIDYRVGVDEQGCIQGVAFRHYVRCGWAQDLSLPVADRAMLHSDNAYLLPAARIESHRLRTNTQSATAFRGFGGPQGMLGIERVMDHIAHTLGEDPLEIRRRNFYAAAPGAEQPATTSPALTHSPDASGDVVTRGVEDVVEDIETFTASTDQTTPYGQVVEDFVLHDMLRQLEASSDYHTRRRAVSDWNARNDVLKKGIALTPVKFGISFTLTHLNQAGALVHVYSDGSIHMNHGGTEMGQGLFQKIAQVAADRFGVPVETVKITPTDTAKVPNTSATAASSGSDLNGMAVKAACDTIRDRIADCLAELHQTDVARVRFEDGKVNVGGESMTFAEAAQTAYLNRVSLSATGFYKTPKLRWDRIKGQGRPFFYFAYGASCSEVVIDTLTGEYRILRADILHDAGRSLNPALDVGQVEGGFVQGAGWLTTEELVWDDHGRLRTHAPSTYKIPACADRPDLFNVSLYENENREGTIYRSKAVGEPPFMHGISVFMALSDAVSSCGPNFPDLQAPATFEEVLRAVGRARG